MSDRRTFLKSVAAVAVAGGAAIRARAADRRLPRRRPQDPIRKSVLISMLPKELPYADRFAMARTAGFEAVEMQTMTAADEAAEIKEAATKAGPAHPLGDELGPLAAAAVEHRSGGRHPQRQGHGDVAPEREAVGRRHRAARPGGRRCEDVVPGRVDALAAGHPRAAAADGQGAQRDHRGRGGLEQVPAEPARVRALRRRVRVAAAARLLRRRQRRVLRLPAGLDPHARARASPRCT